MKSIYKASKAVTVVAENEDKAKMAAMLDAEIVAFVGANTLERTQLKMLKFV